MSANAIFYVNRVYPERTRGLGRVEAPDPIAALKKTVVIGEGQTLECILRTRTKTTLSVFDSNSGKEVAEYLILESGGPANAKKA